MTRQVSVPASEVTDLVSKHPDGIRLDQLGDVVTRRFGSSALFHTGSLMGLDLEDLLVILESRNKLRVVKGVVFPCSAPAYVR